MRFVYAILVLVLGGCEVVGGAADGAGGPADVGAGNVDAVSTPSDVGGGGGADVADEGDTGCGVPDSGTGGEGDAADDAIVADAGQGDAGEGADTAGSCPEAVIEIAEGEEVCPQAVLHLDGTKSIAKSGAIAKWKWTVQTPPGSLAVFAPADDSPTPTLEVDVAGTYEIGLEVWDGEGVKSCVSAVGKVAALPCGVLHVELSWTTPGDPDPSDTGPETGADLDLHFLHPNAVGSDCDGDGQGNGWFDHVWDAWWMQPHPSWGSADPAVDDDPWLDIDDTGGHGPENLNLQMMESGTTYRIGVHYWNDHGFGPSLATVRVYLFSQLQFEMTDVLLEPGEMWEVATVDTTGTVSMTTDGGGGPKIFEDGCVLPGDLKP